MADADSTPGPGPVRWAVQWYSRNRLDGTRKGWMWEDGGPLLFRSRREARAYVRQKYGYIATRHDLRTEPHGWRLPRAVKVSVLLVPQGQDA
jgi:hypothetical protein